MKVYDNFSKIAKLNYESFCELPKESAKNLIKRELNANYISQWTKMINDINVQPKLRTYSTFKSEIKFEKYLLLPSVKVRTMICRLRTSAHYLAIEIGRHHKPHPLPINDRLCTECHKVEDEIHHLINCTRFENIRDKLLICAKTVIPNFDDLDDQNKFKLIMITDSMELLSEVGQFLIKAADYTNNA